jgi:hypothetical protein
MTKWVGHVEYMAENSYANMVFVEKHEGKGSPKRPRKDNINIYGKQIGLVDLLRLVGFRDLWQVLPNTGMRLWIP